MGFGKENGDLFRLAVEASPAAMIVTDADGLICFANAETERMFGYCSKELVGKSIDVLVPPALRGPHKFLRQDFFANPSKRGMGVGRDLKAVRRDATEFPVEIGLTPITTGDGPLVLATVLDITARREAEAALARRAVELERANERLAQFAYVASHDLQEPLRKIAAFAGLLDEAMDRADAAEIARAQKAIRTSALRARALVDDLLSYSRVINDAQRLEELDLRAEIETALEELSEMVAESGSTIKVEAPRARFRADRSQFARLLQNIVANSIKYRKAGEGARVRIFAEPFGQGLARLAISDEGVGFDPEYAAMIFEPFKRLKPAGDVPGTGIGLAICKSIAERHGWVISATAEPGVGATFSAILPILAFTPDSARAAEGAQSGSR